MLLAYGADPDIQAGFYGTALHAAACDHNEAGVVLLLEQDVDVNIDCGEYGTVLQAARAGRIFEPFIDQAERTIQLLKDAGAVEKAEGSTAAPKGMYQRERRRRHKGRAHN